MLVQDTGVTGIGFVSYATMLAPVILSNKYIFVLRIIKINKNDNRKAKRE